MHPFDRATRTTPDADSDRQARAIVSADWSLNGVVNGGYLLALMADAVMARSENQALTIGTAAYLAPTEPGPVTLTLERMATSRHLARWMVGLHQDGRERVRAFITLSEVEEGGGGHQESDPPEIASRDQCVSFPTMLGFTLYDRMALRLDPPSAGWMAGETGASPVMAGWVRFREARPFDAKALLMIADAFPPPIFPRYGLAGRIPTIELSVNVRETAPAGWLRCVFRSRHASHGVFESDGELWTEDGRLLAMSRQIARFRPV